MHHIQFKKRIKIFKKKVFYYLLQFIYKIYVNKKTSSKFAQQTHFSNNIFRLIEYINSNFNFGPVLFVL